MASITDVAKAANVSTTTVSNVINNKGNVSDEVYRRITRVMAELHYHPNLLARNLKSNKTRFIGVVFPNPYGHYTQMLDGIMRILDGGGYHTIVKTSDDYPTREGAIIDELVELGVKGLLIVPSDGAIHQRMAAYKKIPYVLMDRYIDHADCSYVRFDNEKAIYAHTCRLIEECSHEKRVDELRLALVAGPEGLPSENDCEKGFVSACENVRWQVIRIVQNEEQSFRELVKYLQPLQQPMDGFIVTNEVVAKSLREALSVYKMRSKVYALAGESWFSFSNEGDYVVQSRHAVECGIKAAQVLLSWIKMPAVYESTQNTVGFTQNKFERIHADVTGRESSLRLLLLASPATDALKQLLPNFINGHRINVDIEECTYKELYGKLIGMKRPAKGGADIYMIDYPWISWMLEHNLLLQLDDMLKADGDSFLENFIPIVRRQFIDLARSIYTIPVMIGSQMLFYRKDLISNKELARSYYSQFGLELRPPATWSEFNLVSRFFTREHNPESPVKYGTCILGEIPTGIIEEFLPRQWSYNGRFISREGELVISSVQNGKALDNLCEAYRYSVPQSIGYMEDEQIGDFIKGDVALISTFNSHVLSMYNNNFAQMLPNIGFGPLPGNKSILGGWVLGINSASGMPDTAYRFIKWACSDSLSIHNTLLGGLVPKNNVSDSQKLHITYPWLENMSQMMQAGQKRETIRNGRGKVIRQNQFEEELAQTLIGAVTGQTSSKDALKALSRKLGTIIG